MSDNTKERKSLADLKSLLPELFLQEKGLEKPVYRDHDRKPRIPSLTYRDQNKKIPSLKDTSITVNSVKPRHRYTGTNMIGIATLHKSNAVPVFSSEDAKDISKMRRG